MPMAVPMPDRRRWLRPGVHLVGHAPAPSPTSGHAFVRLRDCPLGRVSAFRMSRAFNRDDAFTGVAGFTASCPAVREREFAAVPASRSVARERTFATLPANCSVGG
ncbi:hypothetical protein GCM10027199_51610 [Amycolatopsis magusensis]